MTVNYDGQPFCGQVAASEFSNHRPKWNKNEVSWGIHPSIASIAGIPRASLRVMGEKATAEVSGQCGLRFRYVDGSDCDILTVQMKSDGPGNVLGLTDLPPGDGRQLLLRIDFVEAFVIAVNAPSSRLDLYRIWLHELMHALGVFHIQTGNLLAPFYSASIAHLQGGDVAELVARYGLPLPTQPIPPPLPPSGADDDGYEELWRVVRKNGREFIKRNGVYTPIGV